AGYPIKTRNDYAVFYPGSLRSGQTRKLFLTLQVPTDTKKTFEIGKIKVRYLYNNQTYETTLDKSFNIACVNNKKRVFTSINKTNWSEQVINEDFNRLKQEVASDIKGGEKEQALNRIEEYYGKHEEVNSVMRSEEIAENLDKDLNDLRTLVQDTFKGDSAAVLQKQKNNAKALQYEGYSGRRK
ncbi:MAG: hypothetical protein SV375_16365, partial [Thermodesulfobacteriota bacterium]|nr:hypothetical protein [Thermodesulfobacteriota bacterium]